MGPYSSNACDLGLYPTHSGKFDMMELALLGLPSDGIPGRMCHQWPSLSLVRLVSIAYGGVRCQGGFSPSPPTYSYFPTSLRNFTTCLLTLTFPSDELGHRMCYLSCILWCKRTTLQLKHRRSNHNQMKSQKKFGQHEPAPTSALVGSSVHWMGWDFSSSG
jgi:hypothetical protein